MQCMKILDQLVAQSMFSCGGLTNVAFARPRKTVAGNLALDIYIYIYIYIYSSFFSRLWLAGARYYLEIVVQIP